MMSDKELLAKIESSEILKQSSEKLFSEVSFRAGKSAQFAIMTILMIISIVVQIIAICKKRNNPDKLVGWMKNARTLPRVRTARLKRRLDALWQEHCGGDPKECENNAFFAAVMDMSENATDEEINEILRLADEANVDK